MALRQGLESQTVRRVYVLPIMKPVHTQTTAVAFVKDVPERDVSESMNAKRFSFGHRQSLLAPIKPATAHHRTPEIPLSSEYSSNTNFPVALA